MAEARAKAEAPKKTKNDTPKTSTVAGSNFAAGDEQFRRLIGAFLAAGVALNAQDQMESAREWIGVSADQHEAATSEAERQARGTQARYMGLPQNFLRKRPWTRRGPGRVLPLPREPSKAETAQAEATRRFSERHPEIT